MGTQPPEDMGDWNAAVIKTNVDRVKEIVNQTLIVNKVSAASMTLTSAEHMTHPFPTIPTAVT